MSPFPPERHLGHDMSTISFPSHDLQDSELLERCLSGEREAFGELVGRYQGLICAQAYAICGDLGRSEDVAQETFVAAWKRLATLRDRSRFKAWLCGIARHLALGSVEPRRREPSTALEAICETTPHDVLVSREEEALVWQTLEQLPESYRTALVLFYREQHSVFAVAGALGLSEDAVKQRLSRGRAMLKQQVSASVENALSRSRPSAAFTAAVLGAAGLLLPATSRAAAVAAGVTKGAPQAKLALLSLPVLGSLLGGAVGLLGGWLGIKAAAENATYERQRQAILRGGWIIALLGLLLNGLIFAAIWIEIRLGIPQGGVVASVIAVVLLYLSWLLWVIVRMQAGLRRIAAEERAAGTAPRAPSTVWRGLAFSAPGEYLSRRTLLGWPLVHLLWSDPSLPASAQRQARGWIAVGEAPVGFLAIGGKARGVIAIGGVALGVVAIGGLGFGIATLGGCVLGGWNYGGLAMGWIANGGMGVAWHAAVGSIAGAHDFALGEIATAAHANDAAAHTAIARSLWLRLTMHPAFPLVVPAVLIAVFAPVGRLAAKVRAKRAPAP